MQTLFRNIGPFLGRPNVSLRGYTTFRIGGPARQLYEPRTLNDLRLALAAVRQMKDMPYYILGGGSNLLISDEGVNGAVICMRRFQHRYIARFGNTVRVSAGVRLRNLVRTTAAWGLCGLEDLAGIPGTVGGAVRMNAGTREITIGSLASHVELMLSDGTVKRVRSSEIGWGYRSSNLGERVVVFVELGLRPGVPDEVSQRTTKALDLKRASQPLSQPSAGCFFKNPDMAPAGKLLDEAGLKGAADGPAAVSQKHANFIVNRGGASARNVLDLVEHVRRVIKERYGVELESEVCLWP